MSYAPYRSEPTLQSTLFNPPPATEKTFHSSNRSLRRKVGAPSQGPLRAGRGGKSMVGTLKRALQRRGSKHRGMSLAGEVGGENYPLIVHCHLCWDWVWQRPQQFVSRLSRRHRTLFIEMLSPDPALAAPLARFRKPREFPNLTLLSLQFPTSRWGDGA